MSAFWQGVGQLSNAQVGIVAAVRKLCFQMGSDQYPSRPTFGSCLGDFVNSLLRGHDRSRDLPGSMLFLPETAPWDTIQAQIHQLELSVE